MPPTFPASSLNSTMFRVSMLVERYIDGEWFLGQIIKIDKDDDMLTLKYADDDNIEDMVPPEDVRIPTSTHPVSPKVERKNTLPKPLAGLMEDDSDIRNAHRPTCVVHSNNDEGYLLCHFIVLYKLINNIQSKKQ
jgi:hypothetical protein